MDAGTAVVTGASGGIGLHLAEEHARRGGDVVLVARSRRPLEELAKRLGNRYQVAAHVLPLDLSVPRAVEEVATRVAALGLDVDVLINNAGLGALGRFHEQEPAIQGGVIDLNIRVLTEMSRTFLPPMVERGHGRLLNVASVAAFLPGPLHAVYYASKAYVLSLTEALHEELRGTGVTATALCPGPVRTDFAEAAGGSHLAAFRFGTTPEKVAACGYRAMLRGRPVAVHGLAMKGVVQALRATPRAWARRGARRASES